MVDVKMNDKMIAHRLSIILVAITVLRKQEFLSFTLHKQTQILSTSDICPWPLHVYKRNLEKALYN